MIRLKLADEQDLGLQPEPGAALDRLLDVGDQGADVGGGGAAAIFQGLIAGARGISTLSTGGFGNPLVAAAEAGTAAGLALLAVAVPAAAFVAVVALLYLVTRRLFVRCRRPA